MDTRLSDMIRNDEPDSVEEEDLAVDVRMSHDEFWSAVYEWAMSREHFKKTPHWMHDAIYQLHLKDKLPRGLFGDRGVVLLTAYATDGGESQVNIHSVKMKEFKQVR
jgi:hypothetical protein